jgi:hypothetical protein
MNRLDELVRATLEDRAEQAPSPIPVVNRVLAHRRRPSRRAWLVAAAVAAIAAAVVGIGVVASGPGPRSGPSTNVVESRNRTAAVYSAALQQFLRDSSWQTDGTPDRLWVAIAPRWLVGPNAPGAGQPLAADVRAEISTAVAGLTTVEWVARLPASVPNGSLEQAKATVTLGILPPGEHQVTVSMWAHQGFNNGWLNSYVVERSGEGWVVTGPGRINGIT